MRRIFNFLRDAWFIILITGCLLALIDGILRNTLPAPEDAHRIVPDVGYFNRWAAEMYRNNPDTAALRHEQKQTKNMRWEPYVYWRRAPFAGEQFNIDERGLRETWTPHLRSPSPVVFMMGGSTVWGSGVSDNDTLPSKVALSLSQRGHDVRVVNYGESGWVSTQSLIALVRELHRGNVPDVVVFYDGINDTTAALQEHTAGTPQNESQRRLEFNLTQGTGARVLVAATRELEGVRNLTNALRGGAAAPVYADTLSAEIVSVYETNVRIVKLLAEEWGFDVLFYWQPVIFTKRSLTEHESLAQDFVLSAHRDMHLATNREIAASPAFRNTPEFHDISGILDGNEEALYIDFCHLSPEGNAIVAEAMVADLVPILQRRAENETETKP